MSESLPVPPSRPAASAAPTRADGNAPVPAAPNGEAPEAGDGPPFDGLLDAALAAPETPTLDLLPLTEAANPLAPLPQAGKELPPADGLPMAWNALFLVNDPARTSPTETAGDDPAVMLAAIEGQGEDENSAIRMQMLAASTRTTKGEGESVALPDPAFARRLETLMTQPAPAPAAESAQAAGRTDLAGGSLLHPHAPLAGAERSLPQAPAITVPPQHPQWSQAVGERLHWMVGQQLQSAEIRLDPPELGSLDVKVVVNKDHATVHFVTHNPQVRDALEAATPRLREMFADAGLNLGDVNVSQESFQQQAAQDEAGRQAAGGSADGGDEEGAIAAVGETTPLHPRRGQGLLDTYV